MAPTTAQATLKADNIAMNAGISMRDDEPWIKPDGRQLKIAREDFASSILSTPDFRASWKCPHLLDLLVGAGRFERPTPCAQGRCATRLRYAPTFVAFLILNHFLSFRYCPACPNRTKNTPTVAKPWQNPISLPSPCQKPDRSSLAFGSASSAPPVSSGVSSASTS